MILRHATDILIHDCRSVNDLVKEIDILEVLCRHEGRERCRDGGAEAAAMTTWASAGGQSLGKAVIPV